MNLEIAMNFQVNDDVSNLIVLFPSYVSKLTQVNQDGIGLDCETHLLVLLINVLWPQMSENKTEWIRKGYQGSANWFFNQSYSAL